MIRTALVWLVLGSAAVAEAPPLSCADAGAMTRVFMLRERVTERLATDCIARPETEACGTMRDSLLGSPEPLRPSDERGANAFMLWLLRACAADPAFR